MTAEPPAPHRPSPLTTRASRMAPGIAGILLAAAITPAASALTIRDDASYADQDDALLFGETAPLNGLTDNLVVVGNGSGVYLGDGWVLSAAHFLSDGGRTNVTFSDLNGTIGGDVTRNPAYNGSIPDGGDFALIQLDQVPVGLTGVELYTGSSRTLRNQAAEIIITGFGDTGTGSTGASPDSGGVLHAGTNAVDQLGGFFAGISFDRSIVLADFDDPENPSGNRLGSTVALDEESMVAEGDSGGGVFYQDFFGDVLLVGVNSILIKGNPDDNPAEYSSVAGITTLDGSLPWLAETTGTDVLLAGDVNQSGTIEQGDLDAVLSNWGKRNRSWQTGDVTGDQVVDQADLDLILGNWGASQSPLTQDFTPLPEPGTAALALLGTAVLLRRRARAQATAVR